MWCWRLPAGLVFRGSICLEGKGHEKYLSSRLILSAALTGAGVTPALAASGDIWDLGVLAPNGEESYANDINNAGQVVGFGDQGLRFRAFLYTGTPGVDGQMINLGAAGGASDSYADGISSAGHVTGWLDFGSYARGFLYYNGTMTVLPTLGGSSSFGVGVNASGHVVGEAYLSNGRSRAFFWNGTNMINLGTLPGGTESWATDINDAGLIVGASEVSGGYDRAFVYVGTPGSGQMRSLGTLPGGTDSWAYAVSDTGFITGESDYGPDYRAFLYVGLPGEGGQMYDLGDLGGGWSAGYEVNSFGHVVGSSWRGVYDAVAFLYIGTPGVDGQMIDLDAWLDEVNPVEGAKWKLLSAYGINDSGLIVGTGLYEYGNISEYRAFLLDASALVVPEPATITLLAVGGLALMHRRSRR